MRRSVFALVSLMALLIGLTYLPGAGAQVAGADFDIPGGHFYTQTNAGAGLQFGYRITDEGGIGFWSEFKRLGGVNALGYPASRRFTLDGFIVQATQKVIMQWRPEVSQVYFVNVFDKLHDQSKDSALQQQFGIPPQLDPSFDAGKTPDQIQAARLALLNADAAIAQRYGTGPSAILYNGLPTSQVTDAGPFKIIRAQRVAIQHWNVAGPGGIAPGAVSVVNGGDVAKTLGLVPPDAQITETTTGQPAATPTPAFTPTPTPQPFVFLSKGVNTPPIDCGSSNRVPCVDSAPNAGSQFVQGHVLDKSGNGLGGFNVMWTFYGNNETVGNEGDGLFTLHISNTCPIEHRVYDVFVVDGQGKQVSDKHQVVYDNCNTAGEFHFDFVKQI